jgi:hypothetical protein
MSVLLNGIVRRLRASPLALGRRMLMSVPSQATVLHSARPLTQRIPTQASARQFTSDTCRSSSASSSQRAAGLAFCALNGFFWVNTKMAVKGAAKKGLFKLSR